MSRFFEEGYYTLTSKEEPEPVLVHGYYCTDLDNKFVFGFNTHDGGGLVTLSGLSEGTTVERVCFTSCSVKVVLEKE